MESNNNNNRKKTMKSVVGIKNFGLRSINPQLNKGHIPWDHFKGHRFSIL